MGVRLGGLLWPEQEALREFLRRYNDTPHSTTGVSPNQLLFGFSRSSGIPSVVPETPEQREKFRQEALANDARAKKSMEQEYNRRMRVKEPTIATGDSVLIKLKKHRKATSSWDISEPFMVTAVRGSMITATRGDREVTRNSSAFKLFRQKEVEDPGARAQGESKSPESSISKRREEAAPASSAQLDQALEASNQLHETNDEPQRVEQAMPQGSVPQASKKRGRPPAEESERRRKEREAALAARRAEMPPVRRSERRTFTRSSSK